MKGNNNHPENLFLLVDRESADKSYEAARRHVETCLACREELDAIRSVDRVFRSPELEIDLPPFQWARIQARLSEAQPATGWRARVGEVFNPRQYAWKLALGIVLAAVLGVSGLEYRRYMDRLQLAAIIQYSNSEQQRLESVDNPFSEYAALDENPFARYKNFGDRANPFAVR